MGTGGGRQVLLKALTSGAAWRAGGAAVWSRSLSSSSSSSSQQQSKASQWGMIGVAAAAAGLLMANTTLADSQLKEFKASTAAGPFKAVQVQQQKGSAGDLPEYSTEEVSKHKSPKDRVWVTYRDGVYDITDFLTQHPGGTAKIMLAAGGSVEPFWGLYQQHQKQEIRDILEKYRIGSLKGGARPAKQMEDPYKNEPPRHPALLVRSAKPFNGETPAELLVASPITPADVFFTRHHLPVPAVDSQNYKVEVGGAGLRSLDFTVPELQQKFKKVELAATIQCAGNRRAEMKAVSAADGHQIKGLDWDAGAISTAVWGGVLMRDVLKSAGLRADDPNVAHIHFYGHDTDESGTPYAVSVPVSKALSDQGDVIIAWEMNGQPIPQDHGGPLRVIVPGTTGARSVKWIARIVASADECQGHWQQKDYKAFSPGTDWDNLDWSAAPAIQEMPVQSVICEPSAGQQISLYDGEVTLKGYAWSGGGKDIIRVDVSADGGKHWTTANLQKLPHQKPSRVWAWTLWEATVPLPEGFRGQLELVCKATDQAYNTQPEDTSAVWNIRGLINNAWHKVPIVVTNE